MPCMVAGEDADVEDAEGLSEYRDTAVPEALLGRTSVVQNPDKAVLETLRELNQLLGGPHMRTVNEWLRIITQVGHLHCVSSSCAYAPQHCRIKDIQPSTFQHIGGVLSQNCLLGQVKRCTKGRHSTPFVENLESYQTHYPTNQYSAGM